MESILTKELLQKAIDRNILVYDGNNTQKDRLTAQLSGLMRDVAILNYNEELTDLYVATTLYIPDYETSAGLKIHRDERLNRGGEFLKYYFDQGGCLYLTGQHENLVVATGPNGAVLLGSVT